MRLGCASVGAHPGPPAANVVAFRLLQTPPPSAATYRTAGSVGCGAAACTRPEIGPIPPTIRIGAGPMGTQLVAFNIGADTVSAEPQAKVLASRRRHHSIAVRAANSAEAAAVATTTSHSSDPWPPSG